MSLANLAASLVVAKLGAAAITPAELRAALGGMEQISGGILNDEQLLAAVNEARQRGKKLFSPMAALISCTPAMPHTCSKPNNWVII